MTDDRSTSAGRPVPDAPREELVERIQQYLAWLESPEFIPCPRCQGKGYHHGFGERGADPDWCLDCGGPGEQPTEPGTWSPDDLLREALDELGAPAGAVPDAPPARWEPIETAPRDDTRVLLIGRDWRRPHIGRVTADNGGCRVDDPRPGQDGWIHCTASHWMPLPASPSSAINESTRVADAIPMGSSVRAVDGLYPSVPNGEDSGQPSAAPPALRELLARAREAVTTLRDAAREGRVIDFRQRDPLVMAIHRALDELETSAGTALHPEYLNAVADRIVDMDGCCAHDWLVGVARRIKAALAGAAAPLPPPGFEGAELIATIHHNLKDGTERIEYARDRAGAAAPLVQKDQEHEDQERQNEGLQR